MPSARLAGATVWRAAQTGHETPWPQHHRPMSFFRDLNLSAATAGFVAVLVEFISSVAIVFQAALAFGATPELITSRMWALGLGMGLCSAIPLLILKQPAMVAWSTPGAAGRAGGFSMAQAVGAFVACGALYVVIALLVQQYGIQKTDRP